MRRDARGQERAFGAWPFARAAATVTQAQGGGVGPNETYYAISAVDGAIATSTNGDRATRVH